MKKLLISAAMALSLFCTGTAVGYHEIAHANITLPEHKMNYHNDYKKNKLNYVKSIKLYYIHKDKVQSPGYAFFDNQNNLKFNPNKTHKIHGVTYIYTNFLGGNWAKLSDWKAFQKELAKFKADYKEYHAKHGYPKAVHKKQTIKQHHKKASTSDQSASDNSSNSDNASNQTSSDDDSNDSSDSQSTPTINNDANYEAAYRAEALAEINALRASVGVAPLTEDPTLDKIADMRVAQNISRPDGSISHYDDNGNALADVDAKQLGLNMSLSENLAMRSLNDGDSTAAKDVASALTHQYIDEGPQSNDGKEHGHYENLVSPYYQKIGIGFGINTKPDSSGFINIYDAEDFSDSALNTTTNSSNTSSDSTSSNSSTNQTNSSNSSSIPQNTPYMTYTPDAGGGWTGTPTALGKQMADQKFYATHHTETAPDGVKVFIENGKHLDANGQVVNN